MPRMAQNIKLMEIDKECLGWREIQRYKQIKVTTKNAQDGAKYTKYVKQKHHIKLMEVHKECLGWREIQNSGYESTAIRNN